MDGNNAAAHVSYAFTEVAGISIPSRRGPRWRTLWTSGLLQVEIGTRAGVPLRCSRGGVAGTVHGSLGAGRLDDHLHGVSGSAADDPEDVEDRGGAAALRVPRLGSYRLDPCAEHFRRSFRRHGLPSDRPARCSAHHGGKATTSTRSTSGCDRGSFPFLNFFDALSWTSTDTEGRSALDHADLKEMCNMKVVEEFGQHLRQPGASRCPRLPRKRR